MAAINLDDWLQAEEEALQIPIYRVARLMRCRQLIENPAARAIRCCACSIRRRTRALAVTSGARAGETFAAVVTGVTPKGVFVRISGPPAEGLLVRGQQGVDVGDQLQVKLLSTDPQRGYLDFAR